MANDLLAPHISLTLEAGFPKWLAITLKRRKDHYLAIINGDQTLCI